jgi:hypothetical protein
MHTGDLSVTHISIKKNNYHCKNHKMKTPLRIGITLLLALVVQGFGFSQSITTTLSSISNPKTGIESQFAVTTEGGNGQMVRGRLTFSPYAVNDLELQYKAPQAQEYTTLTIGSDGVVMFGPESGFAFAAATTTHDFKVKFNTGKTYNYSLDLRTTGATPQNAVSASGNLTVNTFQESTINGTLDIIDQEEGLQSNKIIEWQILVDPKDRAGEKGNIQIELANPQQRNNITLMYDVRRAITNGGDPDFQPLTFNENGIATIGSQEGEQLTSSGINQIMRVNFSQGGTYNYTIRFLRDDNNPIALVQESVNVANVAGIKDMIGNTRISVYPTLVSGSVRIDLGEINNAKISITDMLGRVVLQMNNATGPVQINTSEFAKGTYFVKVVKGSDVAGSRFIVN